MSKRQGKIYIGTSGWAYSHWRGKFYPPKLSYSKLFNYYSKYFKTVEINSSFYHLPRESTFKNWSQQAPKNFIFSVKVWRRITHLKKLKNIKQDLKIFLERSQNLNKHLGAFLFQFPPNFRVNLKKLEDLAEYLSKLNDQPVAFEFRHPSWFTNRVYKILKKYKFALCWADTPFYPYQEIITAPYLYIRLHGHKKLYASKYSEKELKDYAKKIKKFLNQGKDIFVYFDNDALGYAIENALELKKILKV